VEANLLNTTNAAVPFDLQRQLEFLELYDKAVPAFLQDQHEISTTICQPGPMKTSSAKSLRKMTALDSAPLLHTPHLLILFYDKERK
jgi:hypothetical protein